MKNKKIIFYLILLVGLFIITRLILIHTTNTSTEPIIEEEVNRRGRIAYMLINNYYTPFSLIRSFKMNFNYGGHHQTGTIIRSIITAFFFSIFGISWTSLLLVDILQASILLILVFFFFQENF